MKKIKNNQYLIYEDGRFILYIGSPRNPSATRVDVTMAVKIGMHIAKEEYDEVEFLQV